MKKSKNPLSVYFGVFLRSERNDLGMTSIEVAKEMEIGESYYRLVESGNANFPIAKIFSLVTAFHSSGFIFQQLARFIAGINYIEEYKEDITKLKDSLDVLGQMDAGLEALFSNTKIKDLMDSNPGSHKGLAPENNLRELKHFLSNIHYGRDESKKMQDKVSFVSQKLEEAPSLNLELMINFINELSSHPPLHTIAVARQWEEKNHKKFRKLRGVYSDPDLILREKNLKNFKYGFLANPNFELQFLFQSDKTQDELKDNFLKGLLKFNKELEHSVDRLEKSVQIKTYTSFKNGDMPEEFKYGYWAFHMESTNIIGFVLDEENNTTINTSFHKALELDAEFTNIWKKFK